MLVLMRAGLELQGHNMESAGVQVGIATLPAGFGQSACSVTQWGRSR